MREVHQGGHRVVGRQERGEDVAPLLAGGEADLLAARRHLHEVRGRQLGPQQRRPGFVAHALDRPGGRHRQGHGGLPGTVGGHHAHQAGASSLVVGEHLALSSTRVMYSPSVSMHGAQVGARGPHQFGHLGGVRPRSKVSDCRGRGVGVDRQHFGAELGQDVRHDEAGGPVGVVEDQLEPRLARRLGTSTASMSSACRTRRPRREPDVADLAGQRPAEVLAVEEALDLLLRGLGDVDAALVEEADDDRLAGRSGPGGR